MKRNPKRKQKRKKRRRLRKKMKKKLKNPLRLVMRLAKLTISTPFLTEKDPAATKTTTKKWRISKKRRSPSREPSIKRRVSSSAT